jgi:hypothetical protein
MKYLICNHCGHQNALQTEYLSFCAGCGKKLDNSFPAWKKTHPGQSFEDYCSQMGTASVQSAQSGPRKEKAGKEPGGKSSRKATVFTVLGVLAGAAFAGALLYLFFPFPNQTSEEILSQPWTRNVYGDLMSLETPPLEPGSLPTNKERQDQMDAIVQEKAIYTRPDKRGIGVSVAYFLLRQGVEMSLDGAAEGAAQEMKGQPGVSDFTFATEPFTKYGIPGYIQKGSYLLKRQQYIFTSIGFSRGLRFWQIVLIHHSDDSVGREVAERVISSIRFAEESQEPAS